MPSRSWRRMLTPLAAAILCAAGLGAGRAIAPPPAAGILCSVVNPCYTFAVVMTGIGQATVSATGNISCTISGTAVTGTCSARFYANASITVTVEALSYTCTTIDGTYQACGDIQTDQVTMPKATDNYAVAVDYQNPVNVSIIKGGTGGGRVLSTFPGIDCGSQCSEHQPGFVSTKVTETPDAGSVFVGWTGGCVGTLAACIFNTGSTGTAIGATFSKVVTPPPPTPSPGPTQTAKPSSTPKPTGTPGASTTPPPGSTATPAPGPTAGATTAPGATTGASGGPAASTAGASADASALATDSATEAAGASAGPTDTSNPASPAGTSGNGGFPAILVFAVLALVVVGAGGLAIGARLGRRTKT